MTMPGVLELSIIAFVLIAGVVIVAFGIVLARKASGSKETPSAMPGGQKPPPGYWWDGQKWNPPAD